MSQEIRPSTLVLIDDDPSMARLMSKVIERAFREAVTVEAFTQPLAALKRIEQGGVDILLTDLEMPDIDGLQMLRRAKRVNACTQVLFMTGHSTQDAIISAIELGAADYLLKPLDRELLLELLRQAHQRQVRWQQALALTWYQQKQPVGS